MKTQTRAALPRAWQRMLSGRRLDLLDPSALDIEVEDIAHGLARVARWNGQTSGAHIFSVAQHSLLVETLAHKRAPGLDRGRRLAVLLHDAPEYVIGDMISPFKAVIGDAYKTIERRLLAAIHRRFGLPAKSPPEMEKLIKTADRQAAFLEATRLAEVEQHWPGIVQQGEKPHRPVCGEQVEIGHAATQQRVPLAEVVMNVQTGHHAGQPSARLVHAEELANDLAQSLGAIVRTAKRDLCHRVV